jgi:hypothetical protein
MMGRSRRHPDCDHSTDACCRNRVPKTGVYPCEIDSKLTAGIVFTTGD